MPVPLPVPVPVLLLLLPVLPLLLLRLRLPHWSPQKLQLRLARWTLPARERARWRQQRVPVQQQPLRRAAPAPARRCSSRLSALARWSGWRWPAGVAWGAATVVRAGCPARGPAG